MAFIVKICLPWHFDIDEKVTLFFFQETDSEIVYLITVIAVTMLV